MRLRKPISVKITPSKKRIKLNAIRAIPMFTAAFPNDFIINISMKGIINPATKIDKPIIISLFKFLNISKQITNIVYYNLI